MKKTIVVLTILALGPGLLSPQDPNRQPPTSNAGIPPGEPNTSKPSSQDDVEKACKEASLHQPAYEYCHQIAVLLSGNDGGHNALRRIVGLKSDAVQLANAYSIFKTNSLASETDQKVAANRGQTKQVGSPAAGNGSTSLVGKAGATNLLAVAVESGALTQMQTGNTITLQANPADLFRDGLLGTPQLGYLPESSSILENFTVSAGLATNANSTVSVPTSGSATSAPVSATSTLLNSSATKLSSVTVNYEFRKLTQDRINKYLISHKVSHLFVQPDGTTSPSADKASSILRQDVVFNPTSDCDAQSYIGIVAAGGDMTGKISQAVARFNGCFNSAMGTASEDAAARGRSLDSDWSAYNQALQADIASFQKALKNQISGWDLATQYVFNKPVNQPETHDIRLIGSGDLKKSQGAAWTVNGAASIYQDLPAGAQYGRLKDAQFSGELDKSWGTGTSAPVIGLAGYGQYQSKPSVLNITASSVPSGVTLPANSQVFLSGTQGWLGVLQIKTTVRVAGSQIPIAVKWSNKPDLLGKSRLGAQFGVNYDFSQLKQLIGKGSQGN